MFKLGISAVCNTSGTGLWSRKAASVMVESMFLGYINQETNYGELGVEFNLDTWDVCSDGLIYTDPQWLYDFRAMLLTMGFTEEEAKQVGYSEQGMQTGTYVSMDIGEKFLKKYIKMYAGTI